MVSSAYHVLWLVAHGHGWNDSGGACLLLFSISFFFLFSACNQLVAPLKRLLCVFVCVCLLQPYCTILILSDLEVKAQFDKEESRKRYFIYQKCTVFFMSVRKCVYVSVCAAMNPAAVFHNRTLQKLLHRKHFPRREKTRQHYGNFWHVE